jgi:hypothetical protein
VLITYFQKDKIFLCSYNPCVCMYLGRERTVVFWFFSCFRFLSVSLCKRPNDRMTICFVLMSYSYIGLLFILLLFRVYLYLERGKRTVVEKRQHRSFISYKCFSFYVNCICVIRCNVHLHYTPLSFFSCLFFSFFL